MTGYQPRAYGPAQPIRASEIKPGDRVTVGDHTGWLRVYSVKRVGDEVELRWWFFGRRTVAADTWVWVIRP